MMTLGEIAVQPIVAMTLLTSVLVVAAISDCRSGKVRNVLTYGAIGAGLGWAVLGGWLAGGPGGAAVEGVASVAATGAALLPFAVIFTMGGLGGGDVKLMAAVGAISGDWRVVLATAVYAFVVAAVMAVGVMVGRGLVVQTARRVFFGAVLSASKARVELAGGAGGEREDVRLPFAVAIAVGGVLAGMELLLGVRTPWAGFVG